MSHHKDDESDLERIKKLIEVMKAEDLVELEIKHGDDKILLKRSSPQQVISAVPMMGGVVGAVAGAGGGGAAGGGQGGQAVEESKLEIIKSPIVGTFYATPSPDSEPFVEVGSKVEGKSVVCIIEAMKVMNEIKAEISGTIVEILVKNGQSVEYGQGLFKVRGE